ncbi:hypothetical protein [Piscinibacter gummiphilus]|uniref:Uncharacterized protein n=1 Tax=Piscinibacter gummiphilus TaxID=946333 RepID=A0ABZ0CZM3_9BURK|nr:hypothetical protein [Piscinibacter gummiphilus]WOB07949.1 hypothetical protein RXV79_23980 [Piscinibacter gummiphilus]
MTLSEDNLPTGVRIDRRSSNYFPAAAGDSWTYERRQDGGAQGETLTRTVSSESGTDVRVTETAQGESNFTVYRRTSEGIVAVQPMADAPAVVNQIVGDLLEYAEPFYQAGARRSHVRQGSAGEDFDGDGVTDSFRIELRQVFVGFERITLPNGSVFTDVARFHNEWLVTLQPSNMRYEIQTSVSMEEAWWAPRVGLIRAERSMVDASGAQIEQPYTLVLTAGTVAGVDVFGNTGNFVRVPLLHAALVFDATRNRYYASVPGSVPVYGNQIAIIEPTTGAVTYAGRSVGSQPAALVMHPSGNALYVGLNGTGEVVKLNLPDFSEAWRVRLPSSPYYGQMLTEKLAVSPSDADVIAVSLMRTGVSPRHGGVVLVRGGVLQPRMTGDHTGSNLITFGADGSSVYGFNNESTEFGLRRMSVVADGLQQVQVVSAGGNFGTRTLEWSPHGLLLDRTLYRSTDLAQLGQVGVEGTCRVLNVPNRLVCTESSAFSATANSRLAVVDATTQVILGTPVYGFSLAGASPSELVAGPAGQVAIRTNATYWSSPADSVVLFNSVALQ